MRSLEATVLELQTSLTTVLARLAAVEASCKGGANVETEPELPHDHQRRLNSVKGGSYTTMSENRIKTTYIQGAILNVTDIYLAGTLYVDGIAWEPNEPTTSPTSSPPSPSPSSMPTISLLPGHMGSYGGGWAYVHEPGASATDINDLETTAVGSYTLHTYVITEAFNEVLVQRVSPNWCDSWGKNTGYWKKSSVWAEGASMGINADNNYFYYYNNAYSLHTWMRQPTSYMPTYGGYCGGCYQWQSGYTYEIDPPENYIDEMEDDGSVVKIVFSELKSKLIIGNFDALIGTAGGCDASGPVSYRVFTRNYVDRYGLGWAYVHESGSSATDMSDIKTSAVGSYTLHTYVITEAFNEVLVQRMSDNWCDSWGHNTGHWVRSDGASMGVCADDDFFYYFNNNYDLHTWMRQPTSYMPSYGGSCGTCFLWQDEGWVSEIDPEGTYATELEDDGSVVKIHFAETKTKLTVGNFDAFIGASGGCEASGPVSYRVFTRMV